MSAPPARGPALPALHPDRRDAAWNEFCDALYEALGGRLPGRCQRHGSSHYYARRLLEERGFDGEASLALYREHGGYCDCEILMNVQDWLEDELAEPTEVGAR